MRCDVLCLNSAGAPVLGQAEIADDRNLVALQPLGEPEVPAALAAVFASEGHYVYIFARAPAPEAAVATRLPAALHAALFFLPLLPLWKTPEGFQAVTAEQWSDMLSLDAAGAAPASSAQESVVSHGQEEDLLLLHESDSSEECDMDERPANLEDDQNEQEDELTAASADSSGDDNADCNDDAEPLGASTSV